MRKEGLKNSTLKEHIESNGDRRWQKNTYLYGGAGAGENRRKNWLPGIGCCGEP